MNKFLVKHPIITEKATDLSHLGKYVFLVDDEASSPEIKKIIETKYGIDVIRVNVINAKPKKRRLGRNQGVKPGYKKAIVTLKKGQKLDIMPH
ncbi:MAG: 50S ribosomal protein L23 [Candidatus Harrisonbacteria bacterium RIFCSPHIGHO2_01_FULL_44_13]|uniref:Large ribosomal subunit protein uL23 n=1 Tax=Candidatus Harrisonbacteria bacterium RIFCSPLOWO2_01_FULL_44_18 TaxID=1798407 RepID=A0A1G1ZP62_9BACT|nr:MAG: 50S ribosomal protein L23 [Candidatus Harrisonbacteria bacterium RIFCSPHIGHO2_01_FULL_44_13]OGY65946.1 MAG: 50S ribosomal protein L23 [Candidatus Harrisonbacteria bacterium RIFCSPLOWO2_01_FULL_44_18]